MSVPPRLVAALRQQLALHRRGPAGPAGHTGFGEWIGDEIAVGSFTTATTLVADLGVLGRVALTIA